LQAWTDWTPSARSRRWKRRKRKKNTVARAWMQLLGSLTVLAVVGGLVWFVQDRIRTSRENGSSMSEAALSMIRGSVLAQWQQDTLDSLDTAAQQVGDGQMTQAEIGVDRAASLLTAARLKSQRSDADFFQMAVTALDRVWSQRPDNDVLFQHVTEARIELATLRVAQKAAPPASREISIAPSGHDPDWIPAVKTNGGNGSAASASNLPAPGAAASDGEARRVSVRTPREMAANFTLNPASLGGNYLDATAMPATAEILLPPARRSFEDNVRVDNLTIAGAAQTLDAIHWSNVTFVGTRLRYEKGPLDLHNVHFAGCTFGFPADARGARLADAIALGQTSFTSD
jgi:hypothetical protein